MGGSKSYQGCLADVNYKYQFYNECTILLLFATCNSVGKHTKSKTKPKQNDDS